MYCVCNKTGIPRQRGAALERPTFPANSPFRVPERALELMGHVAIPFKWKEFVFHRGRSFDLKSILDAGLIAGAKKSKEGRQTVDHEIEEEFEGDLSKPRKIHYETKWKHSHDAVFCIHLATQQKKGLTFLQTRSHAIIFKSSVPPDCIEKMVSQQGETTFANDPLRLGQLQEQFLKMPEISISSNSRSKALLGALENQCRRATG